MYTHLPLTKHFFTGRHRISHHIHTQQGWALCSGPTAQACFGWPFTPKRRGAGKPERAEVCESPSPRAGIQQTLVSAGAFSHPIHGAWQSEAGQGHKQNPAHQWRQRGTHSETRDRSHTVQQPPNHSSPLPPLCWCRILSCLFGLSGQRTNVSREANGKFLSNQRGYCKGRSLYLLPARR